MSDPGESPPGARPTTAGALLRQARQAQGLHIAALAAAIKVVPRKLELLESDQFDQLPDATFTRALAQTVCRTLKIDPTPILALLPPPPSHRLEQVSEGLNMPFRERPGRLVPTEWASLANPVMWIAAAIAALTFAVYMMPAHWWPFPTSMTPVAPALDAAVPAATLTTAPVAAPTGAAAPTPGSASSAVSGDGESPAAAASESVASAEPDAVAAAAASAILQFRTSAQSWVEVTDSRGQALISRLLEPGESVGVDGVPPLKVSIGNASATQVVFRGQALELASHTRDNVARLDLK